MGFLKRLAGALGFGREDVHGAKDGEDDSDGNKRESENQTRFRETGLPRKGFGVPIQVVGDRTQIGPILVPCSSGEGGVQGLRWCSKRLRIDKDGDVADEFLDEILPETSSSNAEHSVKPQLKLEPRHDTRPVKVKGQMVSSNGKFQHCIEHQGRLQWV